MIKSSYQNHYQAGVIDPDAEVDKEIDTILPDTSKEADFIHTRLNLSNQLT